MSAQGSPGASASSPTLLASHRCIAAVDLDCFYAQCEELRRPELKGTPIGVQQKTIVITSNYAARAFGLQKGETLAAVKQKCPQITICNGEDLAFYREVSQKIFTFACRWAHRVERLGMDEVFLDITETVDQKLQELRSGPAADSSCIALVGFEFPEPEATSHPRHFDLRKWDVLPDEDRCWIRMAIASEYVYQMRMALHDELGLTTSAGVSVSKLLAKLVSSTHKPHKQTVAIPTVSTLSAVLPDALPIQRIPGIGFSGTQKWNRLGIITVKQLLDAVSAPAGSSHRATMLVGHAVPGSTIAEGRSISDLLDAKSIEKHKLLCLGVDDDEVMASGPPKTCSTEDSFWVKPLQTPNAALEVLQQLAKRLMVKLRADDFHFGPRALTTLAVTVRHAPDPAVKQNVPLHAAAKRERRQVRLDSSVISTSRPRPNSPPVDAAELSEADLASAARLSERAAAIFRQLVPDEAFALHILNMQVQYAEALSTSQRRLQFQPQAVVEEAQMVTDDHEETPMKADSACAQTLISMGFDKAAVLRAIAATEGKSTEAAIEHILASKATTASPAKRQKVAQSNPLAAALKSASEKPADQSEMQQPVLIID
mmetsp:Transcript_27161/g.63163  ORF Transcript_27161/g.63163 Transcript_27161/m.63163 type:complete len:600 (-) Transcript_27161:33-1832(-)